MRPAGTFALCAMLLLSACSMGGPKQPFTYRKTWSGNQPAKILSFRYNAESTQVDARPYFKDAYADAPAGEERREVRNRILFELMGMVDDYYYKNTVNLRDTVIGKNLLTELAGIGTSFAAALTGGEQMKTVLSAISTGIQTFNTAVDKEVFLNTSVQAIRFQMDASRADIATQILKKMKAGTADYPLESGLRDIIAYYDAGTVTAGLTALAAKAAESKANADSTEATAQLALAGLQRGVEDSSTGSLDD